MMNGQRIQRAAKQQKTDWLLYLLIAISCEKIIQHIFVTLAFFFNWSDIRSTVAVNPDLLLILGVFAAVLFVISLWGLVTHQVWVIKLLIGLALFDMVGEFVAQGTLMIVLNVSFLVATLLLVIAILYSHQRRAVDQPYNA